MSSPLPDLDTPEGKLAVLRDQQAMLRAEIVRLDREIATLNAQRIGPLLRPLFWMWHNGQLAMAGASDQDVGALRVAVGLPPKPPDLDAQAVAQVFPTLMRSTAPLFQRVPLYVGGDWYTLNITPDTVYLESQAARDVPEPVRLARWGVAVRALGLRVSLGDLLDEARDSRKKARDFETQAAQIEERAARLEAIFKGESDKGGSSLSGG